MHKTRQRRTRLDPDHVVGNGIRDLDSVPIINRSNRMCNRPCQIFIVPVDDLIEKVVNGLGKVRKKNDQKISAKKASPPGY